MEEVINSVAHAAGHPLMIPLGLAVIGLLYWFVNVDVANIAISVVTFALLPILQHTQNRDGQAIQAKLDELIRASEARNEFIGLDRKPEKDIEGMRET